jgi:hypothetical protein
MFNRGVAAGIVGATLLVASVATAQEEEEAQTFDVPLIAFDVPLIAFDVPLIAFDDPIYGFDVPLIALDASFSSMQLTLRRYGSLSGTAISLRGKDLSPQARRALTDRMLADIAQAKKYHQRAINELRKAGKRTEATGLAGATADLRRLETAWKAPGPIDIARAHAAVVKLQGKLDQIGAPLVPKLRLKGALVATQADLVRMEKLLADGKQCPACWPSLELVEKQCSTADKPDLAKTKAALAKARATRTAPAARAALAEVRTKAKPVVDRAKPVRARSRK